VARIRPLEAVGKKTQESGGAFQVDLFAILRPRSAAGRLVGRTGHTLQMEKEKTGKAMPRRQAEQDMAIRLH
jgi:hypothetical protein